MKRKAFKKSFWQSLLSAIALVVFAYFAIASFGGTSQQKIKLPDGRYEVSKQFASGNSETTRALVDENGLWDGPAEIIYENEENDETQTENVNMKEGKRHGVSVVTYPDGHKVSCCYQHGKRVEMENCEESDLKSAVDNSAYHIFSYELPWFVFKLDACGYDSSYVKAYMDTLELVLYSSAFGEDEFDDFYDDVISNLEETAYDSIIQLNNELFLNYGIDLILSHEFRLATLYSFGRGDSNTYPVIESIYPNYLLYLNALEVTDADFEGFCSEYDALMSSYDPIALDDPFLIDSLDARMYRTLDSIYSSDEAAAVASHLLKSAVLSDNIKTIRTLKRNYFSQNRPRILNKTPHEVAEVVLLSILVKLIDGDVVKSAVREAYDINNGIVRLPTVITNFSGNISPTSVHINGNVIEDGGGEITSRGIAWGTIYNPTLDNQVSTGGSGTGDFVAILTELTEGETYYARAFATNSAGTAYGNCISFIASSTIGIDARELSNLDFNLYPNPASDHITITFQAKDSRAMVLTFFDLNGKVAFQKELAGMVQGENRISVDISEIMGGLYTCQIKGGENMVATQKLFINR